MDGNNAACEVEKEKVPDEPDEEHPDQERKMKGVGTDIKISSLLFILLYDCVEHASMGIKQQHSDLDRNWTKGLQLQAGGGEGGDGI